MMEQPAPWLVKARAIAKEVVAPNAERWDAEATWPEEAMRALQSERLAGLLVAEAYGGLGQTMLALAEVCEVLGYADASTGLCFGMHSVATACIAAKASGDHVDRFLSPIARGKHLTTLALSEPETGSHFYLPRARLTEIDASSYRLDGTKAFVTNGGRADSYVVSTAGADGAPAGHFSMVLVGGDAEGVAWGPPWQGWGMRGNSSRTMQLHEVVVRAEDRLGQEGDQIWYVFKVVAPYFLVAMTGTYLGIAARAVHEAQQWMTKRHYSHTGAPLAEITVLQHRLGTVWARLQRTRQLCFWAAREADRGGPQALPALCAAKAEVGHAVVDVVNECMTLVGGVAYRDGSVLQRLLRDARAAHVMSPTTDILYTWAGRALLDLPLLGE